MSRQFLYHVPTYRLVDPFGEKKPNSKLWPEETKVSPSMRDWVEFKVSFSVQNSKKIDKEIKV